MQVLDTNNYVSVDGTIHHNSGKSSGCVAEIISRGIDQAPNRAGVRRTRWSVVRNTYKQLFDTTMKTFFEWLPPTEFGNFNITNHQYLIDKIELNDGTRVEIEVLFRALDKPEDVRNVLSLEITAAWLNELREMSKIIVDGVEDRTGRFPPEEDGGCTWRGVIADTNPPDVDSWIYRRFEEEVKEDIEVNEKYVIFKQPSGRSPEAENTRYLRGDYYKMMQIGKDPEYVKVYVDGQYGYTRDGKPVWANYFDSIHYSPDPLKPIPGMPLIIGFDFGMHTAAVIGQPTFRGGMNILREMYEPSMGLRRFVQNIVKPMLFRDFRGFKLVTTCDPSGIRRQDSDERSAMLELKQLGFQITPPLSNSWMPRYNAVDFYLTKLIEGKAAFQLDPSCKLLRRGFIKDYKFKRVSSPFNAEKFSELPDKRNDASHPQDCVQYICMVADNSVTKQQGYDIIGERYEEPKGRYPRRGTVMPPDMSAWT